MSAFHLSKDQLFVDKAVDLADRLMVAFSTPSGLPTAMVNLKERSPVPNTDGLVSISEVSSLQLEFRYLATITGNYSYWHAVEKVCTAFSMNKSDRDAGYASH